MTGFHLQSLPSVQIMTIRKWCDKCKIGMLYDAYQCDSWCLADWNGNPFSLLPCLSNLPFPNGEEGAWCTGRFFPNMLNSF